VRCVWQRNDHDEARVFLRFLRRLRWSTKHADDSMPIRARAPSTIPTMAPVESLVVVVSEEEEEERMVMLVDEKTVSLSESATPGGGRWIQPASRAVRSEECQ